MHALYSFTPFHLSYSSSIIDVRTVIVLYYTIVILDEVPPFECQRIDNFVEILVKMIFFVINSPTK